jgi:hypothetical protein
MVNINYKVLRPCLWFAKSDQVVDSKLKKYYTDAAIESLIAGGFIEIIESNLKGKLRIGNIVNYEGFGSVTCVDILCDGINTKNYQGINYGFLKPIKLTQEHLRKASLKFKKLGFNNLAISYGLTSEDIHFVIGNYYHKLEYLHDLQNMYYEFTKHELEFKEIV